jgi:hypothetical protein
LPEKESKEKENATRMHPLLEVENKARASYQEGNEKSIPLIIGGRELGKG